MLRQSGNDFVRSNIFVNADLTPADALAAYEVMRQDARHDNVELP